MYEHELPTLSQISNWDVQHLVDAVGHWSRTADLWEESFHGVWQTTLHPGGSPWDGKAAETTQDLTWRDLVRVRGSAEAMRHAARIAHTGAESLSDVKRLALNAVDEAHTHGFAVAEDLAVTPDAHPASHLTAHPTRLITAAEHAEDIKHLAANLLALDHDIARRLHSAALAISEGIPYLAEGCA